MQAKLYNVNNDIAIFCRTDISDYLNLCFTIDTGASSSIMKENIIKRGTMVTRDNTEFRGLVKNQVVRSIAKIKTFVIINGTGLEHTFFIIKDDINLKNDAIIGSDFMSMYRAKIDYLSHTIKFQFPVYGQIHKRDKNEKDTLCSNNKSQQTPSSIQKDCLEQKNENLKVTSKNSDKIINESIKINSPSRKQKNKKKISNKNFYSELPLEYFNKYRKLTLEPVKIYDEPKENLEIEKYFNEFNEGITELNQELNEGEKMEEETSNIETIKNIYFDKKVEISNKAQRVEYLEHNIKLDHCTIMERAKLKESFKKFSFAFQIPGDRFQHTNASIHSILLKPK